MITFADGRSPILMRTLRLIFWIKQWTKLSLSLVVSQNKNILQVLDKPEDVSDALLSRFDSFSVIMEYGNFITLVFQ